MTWSVSCPECGVIYEGDSAREADLAAERHTKKMRHPSIQRGLP